MRRVELSAPARGAAYVAALAVVLALGLGVSRLTGDDPDPSANGSSGSGREDHAVGHDVAGLAQESDGYGLELPATRGEAGSQPFAFTVVGPDGEPVTAYDEAHERDLHLVAVRRDLTGFQHVHPTLDAASGAWSTTLELEPGSWRVLADFVPEGGDQVVLGADYVVDGAGTTTPLGEDALGASVDGYDVILEGSPAVGEETELVATVMRDGLPVTDLGDYLGELGHLVVLRDGDVAYVHGHPGEEAGTGPTIPSSVTFPSGGRYRLFLEFEHAGAVHTAAFTVSVEAGDGHTHSHGDEDAHEH